MSAHHYIGGACAKCNFQWTATTHTETECPVPDAPSAPRRANFIGAPGFFLLNQACRMVDEAYPDALGLYLVGSSLTKRNFRDVDLRLILLDADYAAMFPGIGNNGWLHPRWSLVCSSIALYLSKASGLPVDFQFQAQGEANREYPQDGHPRCAMGMFLRLRKETSHG
jgi:hypothetical protein